MDNYIARLLEEAPEDMSGIAITPAAANLFQTTKSYARSRAIPPHCCEATLSMYASPTGYNDSRRHSNDQGIWADYDDYKKLARCIEYLRDTKSLSLTLEVGNDGKVQWWIDASFAIHHNMRGHTGTVLIIGKGAVYAMSTKLKINTKSSTKVELVGVGDGMPMVLWTWQFLIAQGSKVSNDVVYQDNQSAIIWERNSWASTRQIGIHYFFASDRIANGEPSTQGSLYRKFRAMMLNLPDDEINPLEAGSQECVGKPSVGNGTYHGHTDCPGTTS